MNTPESPDIPFLNLLYSEAIKPEETVENPLTDANRLYEAGKLAIKGSHFKYKTQLFALHLLSNVHKIKRDLIDGAFSPEPDNKFVSKGRGKTRFISNNTIRDKTLVHALCDDIITPIMSKYLIYDNSSSQKNKGISFHRKRFENKLREYYKKYHTNQGYILLMDFSGYYANLHHKKVLEIFSNILQNNIENTSIIHMAADLIKKYVKTFEVDVSRFSDEEVLNLYKTKVDPAINIGVPKELITGKKMLKKGMEIGNQLSQNAGLLYAASVDNCAKIVNSCHYYGRYTDDVYAISPNKEYLKNLLYKLSESANKIGLFINLKKTKIVKISEFFRYLQIMYKLEVTGRLVRKINPRGITRERIKLKKYKKLLDRAVIAYKSIESSFKSWICSHYQIMSRQQLRNLGILYMQLFKRMPAWNGKHSRIKWLLSQKNNAFRIKPECNIQI